MMKSKTPRLLKVKIGGFGGLGRGWDMQKMLCYPWVMELFSSMWCGAVVNIVIGLMHVSLFIDRGDGDGLASHPALYRYPEMGTLRVRP